MTVHTVRTSDARRYAEVRCDTVHERVNLDVVAGAKSAPLTLTSEEASALIFALELATEALYLKRLREAL